MQCLLEPQFGQFSSHKDKLIGCFYKLSKEAYHKDMGTLQGLVSMWIEHWPLKKHPVRCDKKFA